MRNLAYKERNSRWIIGLNVNVKTIKFLIKKIRECCQYKNRQISYNLQRKKLTDYISLKLRATLCKNIPLIEYKASHKMEEDSDNKYI